jgi:hypothetical protein
MASTFLYRALEISVQKLSVQSTYSDTEPIVPAHLKNLA